MGDYGIGDFFMGVAGFDRNPQYDNFGQFVASPFINPGLSPAQNRRNQAEIEDRFTGARFDEGLKDKVEEIGREILNDFAIIVYDYALEIAQAYELISIGRQLQGCNALRVSIPVAIETITAFIPIVGTAEAAAPMSIALGNAMALLCAVDAGNGVQQDIHTIAGQLQASVKDYIISPRTVVMKDEETPKVLRWEGGFCHEGYYKEHLENEGLRDFLGGKVIVANYMNNTAIAEARECKLFSPDSLEPGERNALCENAELACNIQGVNDLISTLEGCIETGENYSEWWIDNGYPPRPGANSLTRLAKTPMRVEKAPMIGLSVSTACLLTPSADELLESAGANDYVRSIVGQKESETVQNKFRAKVDWPTSIPNQLKKRLTCIANNQLNGCGLDPTMRVGDGNQDLRRYATAYTDIEKTTFLKNVKNEDGTDADFTYTVDGEEKTLNCQDEIINGKKLCMISNEDFPELSRDQIDRLSQMDENGPINPQQVISSEETTGEQTTGEQTTGEQTTQGSNQNIERSICDCSTIANPDESGDMCLGNTIVAPEGMSLSQDQLDYINAGTNVNLPRYTCQSMSDNETACINLPSEYPELCQWNGTPTQNRSGCLENHHVVNNQCVPCQEGFIKSPGDNPLEGDTECIDGNPWGDGETCPIKSEDDGFTEHYVPLGQRIDYWESQKMLNCNCSPIDDNTTFKKSIHLEYPIIEGDSVRYADQTQVCERTWRPCQWRCTRDASTCRAEAGCGPRNLIQAGPVVCRPKISEYDSCKPICNDPGAVNWSPSSSGSTTAGNFTLLEQSSIDNGCYQKVDKPQQGTGPSQPSYEINKTGLPTDYLNQFIPNFGYVDQIKVNEDGSPGQVIENLQPNVRATNIPFRFWPPGTTDYTESNKISIDDANIMQVSTNFSSFPDRTGYVRGNQHNVKGNPNWRPSCCEDNSCTDTSDGYCEPRQIFFKAPFDSPYDPDNISGTRETINWPSLNYRQGPSNPEFTRDNSFLRGQYLDGGAAWCASKCNESDSCNAFILAPHQEWPSCLLVNRYSDSDSHRGINLQRNINVSLGTELANDHMILYNMTAKTSGQDSQPIPKEMICKCPNVYTDWAGVKRCAKSDRIQREDIDPHIRDCLRNTSRVSCLTDRFSSQYCSWVEKNQATDEEISLINDNSIPTRHDDEPLCFPDGYELDRCSCCINDRDSDNQIECFGDPDYDYDHTYTSNRCCRDFNYQEECETNRNTRTNTRRITTTRTTPSQNSGNAMDDFDMVMSRR